MKHLDLFTGIGGFALAAGWAFGEQYKPIAFCEKDPFCQKVLAKHWPDVPIEHDIKAFYGKEYSYEKPDLVTAGYPCQPFSTASHGVQVAEDLSRFAMGIIGKTRPRYVVLENVQKQTIIRCSEQLGRDFGYSSFAVRISAAQVGADHKRNRWWLIAHPYDKGELQGSINAEVAELPGLPDFTWGYTNYVRTLRVYDGVPNRMDRLKSLGNSIVPKAAKLIFREIFIIENGTPY